MCTKYYEVNCLLTLFLIVDDRALALLTFNAMTYVVSSLNLNQFSCQHI